MDSTLTAYCKALKLSGNLTANAQIVEHSENIEYLKEIFRLELEYRESKRKSLYIKQANFDVVKTFAGYIFDEIEFPASITIEDIKASGFVDRKENLILYGASGRGKTHMSIAAGVCACSRGKKVKFFRATALVNALVEAKSLGNLAKFLKSLEKLDLLVCDELGYIPLDNDGAKLLYQVLADCYERKSLIITTNLEFDKWNNIFYDGKLTAAILDRIVHHSHLILFNSEYSWRIENSLMNAGKNPKGN